MTTPFKEVSWKSITHRYCSFQNAGYDEDGHPYMVRNPVKYPISRAYAEWFSAVTPAEMVAHLRKEKILR